MNPLNIKLGVIDDILKGLPDNARLRSEVSELKSQIQILLAENAKLALEVEKFKNPGDVTEWGDKILQSLAKRGPCGDAERFVAELGIPAEDVEFHFDELCRRGLASNRPPMIGAGGMTDRMVCINTEGRRIAKALRE